MGGGGLPLVLTRYSLDEIRVLRFVPCPVCNPLAGALDRTRAQSEKPISELLAYGKRGAARGGSVVNLFLETLYGCFGPSGTPQG